LDINYVKLTNIYEMYKGFEDKRAVGIEPTTTAWKAVVLPLNYARIGSELFHCLKSIAYFGAIANILSKIAKSRGSNLGWIFKRESCVERVEI
jgi:hypothetical protein